MSHHKGLKSIMKKILGGLILGIFIVASYFFIIGRQKSDETIPYDLIIACDSLGKKKEQCVASVHAWEGKTGHKVKIVEAPTGSSVRLTWVQQQLASKSDIDVYQVDAVWAGMLKRRLEPLNQYISHEDLKGFHPALIANNTVDGDLMALPWYVDLGLLIYRKDLLEKYNVPIPQTWDELETAARTIQQQERLNGNKKLWGFVFSGKAFEGLSCNINEWFCSTANGKIISDDGKVVVNTPDNQNLLNKVSSWIGVIAPPGVLNYAEEDSRGVFQSGNAVFVRHWPYVIMLAEADESPIAGKIGVAPLPRNGENGRHPATLGGWQLAISKYSKNKALAADFIRYLTSEEEQKNRAIRGGYYPPRPELYKDADVAAALVQPETMAIALDGATARPSAQTGLKYNQVSSALWNAAHKVLLGKEKAQESLPKLEKQLNFLSKDGTDWNK